jgi:hypothetical protein
MQIIIIIFFFPGVENRDYDRRDPPRWPRDTPLSAKVSFPV